MALESFRSLDFRMLDDVEPLRLNNTECFEARFEPKLVRCRVGRDVFPKEPESPVVPSL